MKKLMLKFLGVSSLLMAGSVYAGAIQCPGSTNFVNTGDTIQQVIQQCGQPQSQQDVKSQAAIWVYSLMSFGSNHIGFSVMFDGNSVSKLMTSQQLTKTAVTCPQGVIRIGDTPREVVAACGQPTSIRNVSSNLEKERGKITHLIYQPQPYMPTTTFIFKNGQLVESGS